MRLSKGSKIGLIVGIIIGTLAGCYFGFIYGATLSTEHFVSGKEFWSAFVSVLSITTVTFMFLGLLIESVINGIHYLRKKHKTKPR